MRRVAGAAALLSIAACTPGQGGARAQMIVGDWACDGTGPGYDMDARMSFGGGGDLVSKVTFSQPIMGRKVNGGFTVRETYSVRGQRIYVDSPGDFEAYATVNGDPFDLGPHLDDLKRRATGKGYMRLLSIEQTKLRMHGQDITYDCDRLA